MSAAESKRKFEMLVALILMHGITLATVNPVKKIENDMRAVHVSALWRTTICDESAS